MSSPFIKYYSLLSSGVSLLVAVLFLVAGIVAMRNSAGVGPVLIFVGGGFQLAGILLTGVLRFTIGGGPTGTSWLFVRLGTWGLGSLAMAAGVLVFALSVAGMKRRLATLEAMAGQGGDAGPRA